MRKTKPPVGWEHVKNCFPGVAEKFPAGLRDGDTLFRAVKDFDAELVLQSLDAVADVALGRIEPLGGLVDGGAVCDLHRECKLKKCHLERFPPVSNFQKCARKTPARQAGHLCGKQRRAASKNNRPVDCVPVSAPISNCHK